MASEEMSFEMLTTTTDGRTTDACLHYKLTYEPSAQVSYRYSWNVRGEGIIQQMPGPAQGKVIFQEIPKSVHD